MPENKTGLFKHGKTMLANAQICVSGINRRLLLMRNGRRKCGKMPQNVCSAAALR